MTREITGHTDLYCLLGLPTSHSISPAMHNAAFEELGIDGAYLAFDVAEEDMPKAVEGLKLLGAKGWNITMPGKNIMCKLADELSPASEITGASNTIVNKNGKLTAHTTDGTGFMTAAREKGMDPVGKHMTLLGAGGAASAILVQAALDGTNEIDVFNIRDTFFPRLEEMAKKLNARTNCKVTVHDFENENDLKDAIANSDILVNGTSVGMTDKNATLVKKEWLRPGLNVFDVIYNPRQTRLLKEAKEAGCNTANGLYMLLHQGAASFKLWTGQDMPVEVIREKFFQD